MHTCRWITSMVVPQKQSQSIWFRNISWGSMLPDPPSCCVLTHTWHAQQSSPGPPPTFKYLPPPLSKHGNSCARSSEQQRIEWVRANKHQLTLMYHAHFMLFSSCIYLQSSTLCYINTFALTLNHPQLLPQIPWTACPYLGIKLQKSFPNKNKRM